MMREVSHVCVFFDESFLLMGLKYVNVSVIQIITNY